MTDAKSHPLFAEIPETRCNTQRPRPYLNGRLEHRGTLTREQSWLTSYALSGYDLIVTGPGGSGKTHLAETIAAARSDDQTTRIHIVTPHPERFDETRNRSPLITVSRPSEPLPEPGEEPCLLICDEFPTAVQPHIYGAIHKFSQIVIAGDSSQDIAPLTDRMIRNLAIHRDAVFWTLKQIWRSGNAEAVHLPNAILWNGLYENPGSYTPRKQPHVRISHADNALAALCRSVIAIIRKNPKSAITVSADTEKSLSVLRGLANHAQKTGLKPPRIIEIKNIQGHECDILIAFPENNTSINTTLKCINRAKHRTDLFFNTNQTSVMEKIFSTIAVPHTMKNSIFSNSPKIKPASGIHYISTDTRTIIVPMGPDPRSTLKRISRYVGLQWSTKPIASPDTQQS